MRKIDYRPAPRFKAALAGIALSAALSCYTHAQAPSPTIAGTWQLTFQDEFDNTSVDGSKWRLGEHYAGMAGLGGIAPGNVTVSGGNLNIKSTQTSVSFGGANYAYSTGEISTYDVYRQTYGYFEARIKYPAVTGLWPAFWLMPDRAQYGWVDGYYRSYLKFDLTGISPGTINTAELKLRVSAVQAGTPNNMVVMRLPNDSWSESTITWNNKPAADPIWIKQLWSQVTAAGQEITVDVKDYVTQEMSGDKKISLVLADTFMRDKFLKFHSSEAASMVDRPRLVINGATYYATEDAQVNRGVNGNVNYGNSLTLAVHDGYGSGTHTYTDGMEIDAMESLGIWGPNITSHAVHWDGYAADHKSVGWSNIAHPASADGYHTYGVYWQAGLLEFYVDGRKTTEWSSTEVMSCPAFMILSLQLGGWDNNNPTAAVNNQLMQVDWVRAWSGTRTPIASTEIIVDNADTNSVVATGTWTNSSSSAGYHGTNYAHDGNNGKGTKSFRFTPTITQPGIYWVYGRWTADPNRAANVPIDLIGPSGTVTTTVNQQQKGGKWVFLGEQTLSAGTGGSVLIRNTGTTGYVVADAVRFLRVGN